MSVVVSSTAATVAVIAAQNARKSECATVVKGFHSDLATTGEKREFASCVGVLYPNPATGSEVLAAQVMVACCLVSVFVGIALGRHYGTWIDACFAAVLAPLLTSLLGLLGFLVYKVVMFAFGGGAA